MSTRCYRHEYHILHTANPSKGVQLDYKKTVNFLRCSNWIVVYWIPTNFLESTLPKKKLQHCSWITLRIQRGCSCWHFVSPLAMGSVMSPTNQPCIYAPLILRSHLQDCIKVITLSDERNTNKANSGKEQKCCIYFPLKKIVIKKINSEPVHCLICMEVPIDANGAPCTYHMYKKISLCSELLCFKCLS